MKEGLDKNRAGLTLGIFFMLLHSLWVFMIAISAQFLQGSLDWIFNVHLLRPVLTVTQFNLGNAFLLVILTFVCGYAIGWVFTAIWNFLGKKGK